MKRSSETPRRSLRFQVRLSLVAAAFLLIVAFGRSDVATRNVLLLGAGLAGLNVAILTTLRRR